MFYLLVKDINYLIFRYLDKIDLQAFSKASQQTHSSVKDYSVTVSVEYKGLTALLLEQSARLDMKSRTYSSDSTQIKSNLRRFLELSLQLLPDLDISLLNGKSFKEVLKNQYLLNMTTETYNKYHQICRNLDSRGDHDDLEMKELLTTYQSPLQLAAKERSKDIKKHKEDLIVNAQLERMSATLKQGY